MDILLILFNVLMYILSLGLFAILLFVGVMVPEVGELLLALAIGSGVGFLLGRVYQQEHNVK